MAELASAENPRYNESMGAFLVWIVATAVLFAGFVLWQGSRLRRRPGLANLHWKAAILLAALIALAPAFVFDTLPRDEVEVPPGIAEREGVPAAPPSRNE